MSRSSLSSFDSVVGLTDPSRSPSPPSSWGGHSPPCASNLPCMDEAAAGISPLQFSADAPQFLSGSGVARRRTPLGFLRPAVGRGMAEHLDVAGWQRGWEGVAVQLNFPTKEIDHIKSLSGGVSCTERLLQRGVGKSLFVEDVIDAVRSVDNQPALNLLLASYPDMVHEHGQQVAYRNRLTEIELLLQRNREESLPPSSPDRPNRQAPPSSPPHAGVSRRAHAASRPQLRVSVNPPFSEGDIEVIRELSAARRGAPLRGAVGGEESAAGGSLEARQRERERRQREEGEKSPRPLQHAVSAMSDLQRHPFTQGGRRVKVFLTYSAPSVRALKPVLSLAACLKDNQFSVSHEESDSRRLAHDKLGWLDQRFRTVDFILVLITPEYARDVGHLDPPGGAGQGPSGGGAGGAVLIDPSDRALNARYIYKLMQAEYFVNRCVNRRFIPVIMPRCRAPWSAPGSAAGGGAEGAAEGAGAPCDRELVPQWLRNTVVYHWPRHYQDLLFSMIRAERIIRAFVSDERRGGGGGGQGGERRGVLVTRS